MTSLFNKIFKKKKDSIQEHPSEFKSAESKWNKYYSTLIYNKGVDLLEASQSRTYLNSVLTHLDNYSTQATILHAGCGISLIPEVLASFGHNITAVDISNTAISFCNNRKVTQKAIGDCIKKYESVEQNEEFFADNLTSGGIIRRIQQNWLEVSGKSRYDMIITFEIINTCNETELAESFQVFHRFLKPDGVILTNVNNQEELELINTIAEEYGFAVSDQMSENPTQTCDMTRTIVVYNFS